MILHLAAVFGLFVAGASPAAPRVFLEGDARGLQPERIVTIRWAGLPDDAGECELLLVVDGGRGRLRITAELAAALPRSDAGMPAASTGYQLDRLVATPRTRNPARPVFGLSTLFVPPRI